ncbi:MAG: hypothetical protein WD046_05290 [Paracoccaceae bacterium]
MTALGRRFAEALDAARAARETGTAPVTDDAPPPLNIRRMVVALMVGQSPDEVETALAPLRKIAMQNDYGIVIVTDRQDIAIFQHPDCITEFLPAIEQLAALPNPHDPFVYVQNRLAILLRKWEPVQVLPFGHVAVDLFAAYSASAPKTA